MRWKFPLLVILGVMVHATWSVLLIVRRGELRTVGLHGLHLIFPWHFTAAFLLICCLCALMAMRQRKAWVALLLLFPQQYSLMSSAITAMTCTWNGAYADGVQRQWEFIGADQSYVIYLALLHGYAIWSRCREGSLTKS